MVGHDLYEVSKASGNLNEDWHVDQICKMVKQSRGNEGEGKGDLPRLLQDKCGKTSVKLQFLKKQKAKCCTIIFLDDLQNWSSSL